MIRIRFVVHVAAQALPSLTPFASLLRRCLRLLRSLRGSVAVLFASQRLCFFRYLAYIGLVVIVNAVFSKLGVVT